MILCTNMKNEANGAIYDIKSESHDFESRTSELVRQIWNAHIRACDFIKKLIGAVYQIEILCSNMRIKANRAIYDIKSQKVILNVEA